MGLGAPEPLEATEKIVFLYHAPCMTRSEEWLITPCSQGGTWELLSPNGSGLVFLCPGLDWRLRPGEAKDRVQAPIDREPRARASLRALGRGGRLTRARHDPLT
jgi:hypothetical protein